MAIITVSHQCGSHGDRLAGELAQRLGYRLVTAETVDAAVHDRYALDLSIGDGAERFPQGRAGKVSASLVTASLAVCTFLDKASRRLVDVPIQYRCFEIPDRFVVGFGLDYAQRYRTLPCVGILESHVYDREQFRGEG